MKGPSAGDGRRRGGRLADGAEVNTHQTDPNDTDSDGAGLNDGSPGEGTDDRDGDNVPAYLDPNEPAIAPVP